MKYEYFFQKYHGYYSALEYMNYKGKSGWEVVSIIPEDDAEVTVFYKKVIKDD